MIYDGREDENWWYGDGGSSTNYDNDYNYDYDELYSSF